MPTKTGKCARKACGVEGEVYWNPSTQDFYCLKCAQGINRHNPGLITVKKSIRVKFEDGDSLETEITGSDEEILKYYVGNVFNMGTAEDRLVKATEVEFL